MAHRARAADECTGAGRVLAATQEDSSFGNGEVLDFLGNHILSRDQQRACAGLDGKALDDGSVSADHEKISEVAFFLCLFETVFHRVLRGGSDQKNEVFFFILITNCCA